MAKDDTSPGGLFSKVAKFVRNQRTQWNDIDDPSSNKEGGLSRQALKEMIERKRRNDFVRKREFDMLRKLRRREAAGISGPSDAAARPSFFQSSLPSRPDDRARTLKKIDEIEAQMSMQWWKTKHGAAGVPSVMNSSSDFPVSDITSRPQTVGRGTPASAAQSTAYARTAPDDLGQSFRLSPAPQTSINPSELRQSPSASPTRSAAFERGTSAASNALDDDNSLDFTASFAAATAQASSLVPNPASAMPSTVPGGAKSAPVAAQANKTIVPTASLSGEAFGATSGFSSSKLFAVEVEEVQHDPELEEAAIRFANSDDTGAEAGLLDAISIRGTRHQHEDTWMTLLDLYRATGQHERFESLALDFATKFNKSSPMWFSLPELVGKLGVAPPSVSSTGKPDWRSPAILGTQSIAALNAAIGRTAGEWTLDWSAFQSIDADACGPLTKLFTQWATQPVKINLLGGGQIAGVLRKGAVSGNPSVPHDRWHLLLAYLRLAHRADEFELAALDFCVTYEVSPPAWESAKCGFKLLDAEGNSSERHTIIGETVHDSIVSELQTEAGTSTMSAQLASVELSGQVMGEPKPVLDKLEARLSGADVMIVSCSKLIRVDFSAAGSLLNWVTARQSEGRIVHFTGVNRLVAAFFHVIGISEHARVETRID